MFTKTGKDLISIFTNKMDREKLWPNQKYRKKGHTQCRLNREKNTMFACAENPRTSHYVMALMQDQALDQEFSQLRKMDSLRFADASTARMKPESVTELTAHCNQVIVKRNYFFFNQSHSGRSSSSSIIIGFKQILIFISANKFHYSRYTIKLLIFFNHP